MATRPGRPIAAWRVALHAAHATRILSYERDPIPVPHRTVEGMRETQNGVVDQNLDVLRQVAAGRVPQGLSERGMAVAQPAENAPHAGTRPHVFLEQLPTRAVASHEPRDPRHDLDRDVTDCGLRIADCGVACGHGKTQPQFGIVFTTKTRRHQGDKVSGNREP